MITSASKCCIFLRNDYKYYSDAYGVLRLHPHNLHPIYIHLGLSPAPDDGEDYPGDDGNGGTGNQGSGKAF